MNRLRTALFLLSGLFWISAYAEDTATPSAPAAGGASGQDAAGGAASGPTQAAEAPSVPVVLPGAYGTAPIALTPGEGRFAKAPYDFTLNLQQGYDSNVFTTHSNEVGSMTSNGTLGFEMQSASPRNIFTLDTTAGLAYYWHRPGESPENYNGDVKFLFFHRMSPRLNASLTFDTGYYSQPNFSAMNASINQQQGNYVMGNGRLNLSYQWTAKIQTNTSYSLNATAYQQKSSQGSNIVENTFGDELRFMLTPRMSLVLEGRFTLSSYPKFTPGDSNTTYGLLGVDYRLSNRLSTTFRGGLQYRDYTNMIMLPRTTDNMILAGLYPSSYITTSAGNTQTSPYVETTTTYIYGHQSTFQWTNRFGLDSSNTAAQKVTSFRTGVNFNHVLTAKTTLSLGLNYNYSSTATAPNYVETLDSYPNAYTQSVPTTYQEQINTVLGVKFLVTPKFSLNASYTFTDVTDTNTIGCYYRNQFLFGGIYTF